MMGSNEIRKTREQQKAALTGLSRDQMTAQQQANSVFFVIDELVADLNRASCIFTKTDAEARALVQVCTALDRYRNSSEGTEEEREAFSAAQDAANILLSSPNFAILPWPEPKMPDHPPKD